MWGIFRSREPKRSLHPVQVKVDRVTWTFDHPPEVLARLQEASTTRFHAFVLDHRPADADAISRRVLISLYVEFCDYFDLRPMPWGRFDRSLKGAGFERYRSSAAGRPWLYRAVRPGSAIVYKLPPDIAQRSRIAA